jgi:hypothetical protein
MNPYEKLQNQKRKWTPVRPTAGAVVEGTEEAIFRALAMRHMELPVGDFIEAALSEIPTNSKDLLLSNIKDEENHDIALGYVAEALGTDKQAEEEAIRLRDAWLAHPDHTVLKALVAERAIFFVLLPFFRFNGGASLRTVSADISRDERTHVAGNSLVCAELGLTPSASLDKLRKATIAWVMQPLKNSLTNKYQQKDFWLKASDNLMYQGKAPELAETKRARVPAFFEHDNRNLPMYG